MDLLFFPNSILLGIGLAMDAFSVSMANGLAEPRMPKRKMFLIAGCYAFFQYLMPVAGWVLVRFATERLRFLERLVPWIALVLLLLIGGSMILEALQGSADREVRAGQLTAAVLLGQGIATSIDALSVGFTLADYTAGPAQIRALIIAGVTFLICSLGLMIGRRAGLYLKGRAYVLGGVILILIGIEIFVTGLFF